MVRNVRTAGLVTLMLATALAGCDQLPMQPANAPVEPASSGIPAAAPVTPATPLIVTAQGWGPLGIGMTKGRVIEALGPAAPPAAAPVAAAATAAPGTTPDTATPRIPVVPETGICEQFRPERAPAGTLVMIENGQSFWLAFVVALLCGFVLGAVLERVVIRPVEGKPEINAVILTLGLFIVFKSAAEVIFSTQIGRAHV